MPIVNEGIQSELGYIEKPFELEHIKGLFENTDPLMQEMAYALIKGDQHAVDRMTKQALDDGFDANTVMDDGLISGMAIVGIKFRDNIIFVPEVLVAARAMKAGMAHIDPILSASGIEPIGTVIMGTVKGDLHDIGKNLCIMMLRGSGFVVHDLGVDTKPEEFIDAVMEQDAQASGVLTEEAGLVQRLEPRPGGPCAGAITWRRATRHQLTSSTGGGLTLAWI